jgi:hypothetical protein
LDELDNRMRNLLLRLALTSNGTTATMDSGSGGGSARFHDDVLLATGLGDVEPAATYYRRLYRRAETPGERHALVNGAQANLDGILHSRADPTVDEETETQLFARILLEGKGHPRRDVANTMRTAATLVARARREAGLDEEYGTELEDLRGLDPDARRLVVLRLQDERPRASARELARTTCLPYSTVLRDLGQKPDRHGDRRRVVIADE